MISIIISSYKSELFHSCIESIEKTIGLPYEIVKIDNPGVMSIAEAYNQGIELATNNLLCFIHEDVLLKQQNWGDCLVNVLRNESIGVAGVSGSKVMGLAPGAWWEFGGHYVQNIIQHSHGEIMHNRTDDFEDTNSEKSIEVAVVDGVFVAFRKSSNLRFNTKIPGFHAYDLAISLEAHQKCLKVVVVDGILLEHFSSGNIDKGWFLAMDKFYDLYSSTLPLDFSESTHDLTKYENEAFKYYILNAPKKSLQVKYWKLLLKRNFFSKFHLFFLKKKLSEIIDG